MKTHISSRVGQLAGMEMMLEMMEAMMMMMTSSAQELKPDLAAELLIPVIRAVIRRDTGGCEIVALVWVTYPPAMNPRAPLSSKSITELAPLLHLEIKPCAFTHGFQTIYATQKCLFVFQIRTIYI